MMSELKVECRIKYLFYSYHFWKSTERMVKVVKAKKEAYINKDKENRKVER